MVKQLSESKALLLKDIEDVRAEQQAFNNSVQQLKQALTQLLNDEKLTGFVTKFEKYSAKMELYHSSKHKLEDSRKSVNEVGFLAVVVIISTFDLIIFFSSSSSLLPQTQDLNSLKQFLRNPPADTKKTLKDKSKEKLEAELGILMMKLNAESKKQKVSSVRFEDLYKDLNVLKQLLQSQPM